MTGSRSNAWRRRSFSQPPTSGPGYYLRSSVLGGQVITEYGAQGVRYKSHVYGGGALIASTSSAGLVWRYNNPVTGDGRETDAQGKLVGASYLDPDGMDVGATDPASGPSDPGPPPMPMAGAYGSLFPGGGGLWGTSCIVDGIEMGCGLAGVAMDIGAAGQCPDNNCNPRMTKYGLRPLYLTDEGFGFWVPGKKPQNTKTPLSREDISSLIDDVYKIFEKHSGCEDWINKLLDDMRASTKHDVGNIRNILENFRKNGNINIEGNPATIAGGAGPGTINISPDARGHAATVLGEIIHSAGHSPGGPKMGYYDDVAIYNFAVKEGVVMSVDQYKRTYPEWVEKRIKQWKLGSPYLEGSLAHGAIEITCLGVINGLPPKYAKP